MRVRHLGGREEHPVRPDVQRRQPSNPVVLIHLLNSQKTLATRVQVNLVGPVGQLSLPDVSGDVERDHDGRSEEDLEEVSNADVTSPSGSMPPMRCRTGRNEDHIELFV